MRRINIISIIYFSLSILLLIYIFYKSEIVAKGLKHDYYVYYYLVALISIIFSIISLFIKKDLNIKVFLSIVSITVSFYFVELFLVGKSLFSNQVFNNKKFISEYKKMDPQIVPIIISSKFREDKNQEIFPLSGISKKLTNLGTENGYLASYKSDRYGFNNPDKLWDKKNIEFLLIGDSFVHGMSVFDKDSFRGNIERNTQTGVINLGYSGNGPLTELATLKEYFPSKNIKKVIWFYYEENDIADLLNERTNKILSNYLKNPDFNQGLKVQHKYLDNILINHLHEEIRLQKFEIFRNVVKTFKLSKTRNLVNKKIRYKKNTFQIPNDFWQIIKLAKSFSENNGAKFYFVYIPDKYRYIHNLEKDTKYRHYGQIINGIKKMNITVVDLNKEFLTLSKKPLELYAPKSFHLNEKGYALGSEIILKIIK